MRNLLYIPAVNIPQRVSPAEGEGFVAEIGSHIDFFHGDPSDPDWQRFGEVVAWDPIAQREVWRQRSRLPVNGGLLHTKGGLVFQGSAEGYLTAYDAVSGDVRWRMPAGGAIRAAPSTVMVDGRQFIIVPAGRPTASIATHYLADYSSAPRARSQPRLLAFALGGQAATPAWAEPVRVPKPQVARSDPQLARHGALVYESYGCSTCHGRNAEGLGGATPDLRLRLPASLEHLQVMLGGALKTRGMPATEVDDETARSLLAYLTNAAWDAHDQALESSATNRPSSEVAEEPHDE